MKYVMIIVLMVILLSLSGAYWNVSQKVLEDSLTDDILKNNYKFAQNISISTDTLLGDIQNNLSLLANKKGKETFSQSDLDDWFAATNQYYNSLFTTDEHGVVEFMTPPELPNNQSGVRPGTKIETDLMKENLKNQVPFISNPYLAQTGNLMILVSHPVFNEEEEFKGIVSGTIYLERDSSLKTLLSKHEYLIDSSVFVVDKLGTIIYHPEKDRITESVAENPLIQKVMLGEDGFSEIINSREEEYFSAYVPIERTGWGIIAQTPTSAIQAPYDNLTKQMIYQSIPRLLFIIAFTWILTNRLTRPINQLAKYSKDATLSKKTASFNKLKINSTVYEVRELYKSIGTHLHLLNKQIQLDGLTGLYNRRALDEKLKALVQQKTSFSLMILDIDHFKKVNDTYGHLLGDDVLRFLSLTMQDMMQKENNCYRYGGEEFVIILPNRDEQEAFKLAEQLRLKIAETPSPTGEAITISLGISTYQAGMSSKDVMERADTALYQSKNNGRNRTTIYETN